MNSEIKPNISHHFVSCEKVYPAAGSLADLGMRDQAQIGLVVEGSGIHLVLDQAIPCRAGDIFVTPPGIPHAYFLENEGEMLTIRCLDFDAADRRVSQDPTGFECYGLFDDGSVCAYAMLNRTMIDTVTGLLDAIERELAEEKKAWEDAAAGHLSLLLIHIARYIDSSIKNQSDASPGEWKLVLAAIQIVRSNCCDANLTLGLIAQTLHISQARLSRIFQNRTGKRFADYLRAVRIDCACRLLEQSNLTVEEIVPNCGLRDVASFYKNFSLSTGMTPNEYRQAKRMAGGSAGSNKSLSKEEKIMVALNEISENLQKGKAKVVKELVQQAIDEGAAPEQILNQGLLDGMNIIGEKFKNNEVYVPEVLVAARAMNMGMQILKPHLAANGVQATGRVCIGTVQGDLHDIGKNLVKMMLEGKGLEVIDLGTDVPAETFVKTAKEENCQVICCSALLTTTMGVMEEVVKAAEAAGIRDQVKIMIGGAPINEDYCKKIGADCYTSDAASAADAAVEFCRA